ncbi:Death-on-curing protein (plasmid) [Rhodospirillum rubrum ATCC 11170]|uniref:Death-on-curing protein n=1 Tax=Rhodospirillum rubrum (strain ATCC 11170 / ATH 1.1.1 / DSM 467 / LMG 4362 / NCIMB 8255 / S1) TaxID=269796 RepID=Q2RML4_RHORT|nr:type II toxin-antitoxin system death-on-curing family toxin [Rhodospirillum rubrum]ABC24631.1 Death-on-curing protein [Rhodospirillum rubrum ATCC 11170]QXG82489.1 type II toxin-antitoxin system death-on-curing family toxin [Rhodospirillum rubrum]
MTIWRWVGLKTVYAVHDRQLAEHGGLDGLRDQGAVESALARPRNRAAYNSPDAATLAAAYAYGLARNHGFADGNKRTAWVVARLFLVDNGYRLQGVDKREAVRIVEAIAGGSLSEEDVAAWFRQHLVS